jgi:CubicO group peptidase (beta-lactamase class C family)
MTDQLDHIAEWLNDQLPRLLDEHRVPGGSAGIALGDKTIETASGVLDLNTGLSVTTDSVFQLASTTKAWTATAVMRLVDEGLVELDAPIRRYLPEFTTSDEAHSAMVTVRHLLSHTAGFDGELSDRTRGDTALEQYVRRTLPNARVLFAPGRMFSYCNGGYAVLGLLIERLRGVPYAEAIRRDVAEPLGLERFATGADEAITMRPAIGHVGEGPTPSRVWEMPGWLAPAGALTMSVGDLLCFARMHLADGVAPGGTRVLSSASARAMREPQTAEPAAIMAFAAPGLGCFMDPNGIIGADGAGVGQRAYLRMIPQRRLAVAVMTNGGRGEAVGVALLREVIRELAATEWPSPMQRTSPDSVDAERLVGRYESAAGVFTVAVVEGLLRLDQEQTEADLVSEQTPLSGNLRQTGDGACDIEGPDGKVIDFCAFVFGDEGPAELLHIGGMAVPRAA